MDESESVVLNFEEARRVANSLDMLYYHTKESAYDVTDDQVALDAMAIRQRAGIEPNPELLDQAEDSPADFGQSNGDA